MPKYSSLSRIKFDGKPLAAALLKPRRMINHLPAINQTEIITKFFNATVDHLFQPGKSVPLNGFIGDKPSYYKPDHDVYVKESTPTREFYQLVPVMASVNEDPLTYNNLMFYDDFINHLKFQGAIVDNQDRLFGDRYLTWCPPIDLDKFMNFRSYYWIKEGPPEVIVRGAYAKHTVYQTTQTRYTTPRDENNNILPILDPNNPDDDLPLIEVYVDETATGSNYILMQLNTDYTVDIASGTITLAEHQIPSDGSWLKIVLTEYPASDPTREVSYTTGPVPSGGVPSGNPPAGMGRNIDGSTNLPHRVYDTPKVSGNVKAIRSNNQINNYQKWYGVVVHVDGSQWTQNTEYLVDKDNGEIIFPFTRKPQMQSTIEIWLHSDFKKDVLGKTYFQFKNSINLTNDLRISITNDWDTQRKIPIPSQYNNHTYIVEGVGTSIRLIQDDDDIITISDPTDAWGVSSHTALHIVGQQNYTTKGNQQIQLQNGMKIIFTNDASVDNNVKKLWVVNGVGATNGIRLIESPSYQPRATDSPEYHSIERGSIDQNPWSLRNRWFHKDVIDFTRLTSTYTQAERPIIEFSRNIQLYNYGVHRRNLVHLVSEDIKDLMATVNGRTGTESNLPPIRIDGVPITSDFVQNNMNNSLRVLLKRDDPSTSSQNNYIYQITTRTVSNVVVMFASVDSDGVNVDGKPHYEEIVTVSLGKKWSGKELFFDGTSWIPAQQHQLKDTPPLFQLYDFNGNKLQLDEIYQGSNFAGSKIFGYSLDTTQTVATDPVLGLPITHDNNGQIVFENYLGSSKFTFVQGVDRVEIPGYYFYYQYTDSPNNIGTYINDWYVSEYPTQQRLIQRFVAQENTRIYKLVIKPEDPSETNPEPIILKKNNEKLSRGVDYFVKDDEVFVSEISAGDNIEAMLYSPGTTYSGKNAHYEVPRNLTQNPNYDVPNKFSIGQVYEHFNEILAGQKSINGDAISWRDSAQKRNYGTQIIHHSAPLLKAMALATSNYLDIIKTIEFIEKEYSTWKSKFIQRLGDILTNGNYSEEDPQAWINTVLADINLAKTSEFPFFSSQMGRTEVYPAPTWMPATPAFLGMSPVYVPEFIVDPSTKSSKTYLQCHDGSLHETFGDIRDQVLYYLELRIYDSIPQTFKELETGIVNHLDFVSGKFRNNDYSWWEFQEILTPMLDRWAVRNRLDYKTNQSFDPDNRWSWNWSSCFDKDGQQLPGHWRQIYHYYYDTDRPHTHPWEMLGFTRKPSWWESRYGKAPYTNRNKILWSDLERGYIWRGPRSGIDLRYARPNLKTYLPVDGQGKLLDPYDARIVTNLPTPNQASDRWKAGDGSPVETAWRRSPDYRYAIIASIYLMKPAYFVEKCWETDATIVINPGTEHEQTIDKNFGKRLSSKEINVHGEIDGASNELIIKLGIQQWISDNLKNLGKDIRDNFGKIMRGLTGQLAYRISGYTSKSTLDIVSETTDTIPENDYDVLLYSSPPFKEEFYSGVIIEWTGSGYLVNGYDAINPYFKIFQPVINSKYTIIGSTGTESEVVNNWKPNVYYKVGTKTLFKETYFKCVKAHMSASKFEGKYWEQTTHDGGVSGGRIYLYEDFNNQVEIRIPYNSFMRTPQDVCDFLMGYQKHLEYRGWIFDDDNSTNDDSNKNFKFSIVEFFKWSQVNWEPGNFISLSPISQKVRFKSEHGNIQKIESIVHGTYSIVDRSGSPISDRDVRILRANTEITVQPYDETVGIFGIRLYVNSVEHVVVFRNKTIFKDVLYDPLYNVKQSRLRLQGYRTTNWSGRLEAPGFIITNTAIIPNFENSADDFRKIYDTDGSNYSLFNNYAQHTIGFQTKDYLSNLLMSSQNQLDFYRGVLQHKGTPAAMRRLMRSSYIRHNDTLKFLEEWAFHIGTFGDDWKQNSFDFKLSSDEYRVNPLAIEFKTKIWDEVKDGHLEYDQKNIQFVQEMNLGEYTIIDGNPYPILELVDTQHIELTEIHVNIIEPFDGIDAAISIGTQDNPTLFVNNFKITSETRHIQIWDLDQRPVLDSGTTITALFTNPGVEGHVQITLKWIYTETYWLRQVPEQATDFKLSIFDIVDGSTSRLFHKDSHWVWRHNVRDFAFQTYPNVDAKIKGSLPTAGYANVDHIKWYAPTWWDMINLYADVKKDRPFDIIEKTIAIDSTKVMDTNEWEIAPSLPKGLYRITQMVVDVKKGWKQESQPELELVTNTVDDSVQTLRVVASMSGYNASDLLCISNSYTTYPNSFIPQIKGYDTSIKLRFTQIINPQPRGLIEVTIKVEKITNQVLPGDKVWCYRNDNTQWDVYQLIDTGLNISQIIAPTSEQQGALAILELDPLRYPVGTDDPSIITDVLSKLTSNSLMVFDGINATEIASKTFVPVTENTISMFIEAGTVNQIAAMNLYGTSGFYIKDIEMNLMDPFDGPKATLSIGTLDNVNAFVSPVVKEVQHVPLAVSKPGFENDQAITVSVADTTINVAEYSENITRTSGVVYDDSISIRVIRNGNIFLKPTRIEVYDLGGGYQTIPSVRIDGGVPTPLSSNQGGSGAYIKVRTINGQTYQPGVNDDLVGSITDLDVVTSGSGYNYAKVNILGRGMGAKSLDPNILQGNIVPWPTNASMVSGGHGYGWDTIVHVSTFGGPQVTGLADVTGRLRRIEINDGGSDFVSRPDIMILGGGGYGARAVAVLRNGRIVKIFVDPEDPDWFNGTYGVLGDQFGELSGINPTMVSMGEGYASEPRITISGGFGNSSSVQVSAILDFAVTDIRLTDDNVGQFVDPNAVVVSVDDPTALWVQNDVEQYTAKGAIRYNHEASDYRAYLPRTKVLWQITRTSDGAKAWSNQPFNVHANRKTGGTSWSRRVSEYIHFHEAVELSISNITGYWMDSVKLDLTEIRANLYKGDGNGGWIPLDEAEYNQIDSRETWLFEIVESTPWSTISSHNYFQLASGDIEIYNFPLSYVNTQCIINVDNTLSDDPTTKDFNLQNATSYSKLIRGPANTTDYDNLFELSYDSNNTIIVTIDTQQSTRGAANFTIRYGYKHAFELFSPKGSSYGSSDDIIRSPGNPDGSRISDDLTLGSSLSQIGNNLNITKPAQKQFFRSIAEPFKIKDDLSGADVLMWLPTRFADWGDYSSKTDYFTPYIQPDLIHLDNGLDAYELVTKKPKMWRIFQKINMKAKLVYDPFENRWLLTSNYPLLSNDDVVYIYSENPPDVERVNAHEALVITSLMQDLMYRLERITNTNTWIIKYAFNDLPVVFTNITDTNITLTWKTVSEQKPKIIQNHLKNLKVFNQITKSTDQILQVYDPVKGLIPGVAEREIYYKLEFDPAQYNSGGEIQGFGKKDYSWGEEQVGRLWWDLSKLWYLDYEQNSSEYRWRNWGKLAPRTQIDIYEWIRSSVPPQQYQALVDRAVSIQGSNQEISGTAKYNNGERYVEKKIWNHELDREEKVYYYWVKNRTYIPLDQNRKLSAYQVKYILENPEQNDIPWFAAIDEHHIIVSGLKKYLTQNDSVLQLNFRQSSGTVEIDRHNQWKIVQKGDDSQNIDSRLWDKMKHSLIGWDDNVDIVSANMVGVIIKLLDWTIYNNLYMTLSLQGLVIIDRFKIESNTSYSELCNSINNQINLYKFVATTYGNDIYLSVDHSEGKNVLGRKLDIIMTNDDNSPNSVYVPQDNWFTELPVYVVAAETTSNKNGRFINVITVANASSMPHNGRFQTNGVWYTYEYKFGNSLFNVESEHKTAIPIGSIINQSYSSENPLTVPDINLSISERYGNNIRPRQTWFRVDIENGKPRPDRESRRNLIEYLNHVFANTQIPFIDERFDWVKLVYNGSDPMFDPKPKDTEYSFIVSDEFERNSLVVEASINVGQRVLMEGTLKTYGFWTLWEYNPTHHNSDSWGYTLIKAQRWRMQEGEFWKFADWYGPGYSTQDYPMWSFNTMQDLDIAYRTNPDQYSESLVRVNDDGSGRWVWLIHSPIATSVANLWTTVAKQNGTIFLTDLFYRNDRRLYGYQNYVLNDIPFRDGTWELNYILNTIYGNILNHGERNTIFFAMVNSALSQHNNIDWVFKTSFLYIGGHSQELEQKPIKAKLQYEDVLNYIKEIKPYHVKIRDNTYRLSSPIDVGTFHVTDFDLPMYFDVELKKYRRLNPDNVFDRTIMANQQPWKDWYDNYRKTGYDPNTYDENWNPIRKITTRMKFNRVSSVPIGGWDASGIGWDNGAIIWSSDGQSNVFEELVNRLRLPYTVTPDSRLDHNKDHSFRWDVTSCSEIISTINSGGTEVPNSQILHLTPDWENVKHDFSDMPNPFKPRNRFKDTVVSTIVDRNYLSTPRLNGSSLTDMVCDVVPGTIVVVKTPTPTYWIWEPIDMASPCIGNWIQFESLPWDNVTEGGAADDIYRQFRNSSNNSPSEWSMLISGTEFKGIELDGGIWSFGEIDTLAKLKEMKQNALNNHKEIIKQNVVINGNPILDEEIGTWAYDSAQNNNTLARVYRVLNSELISAENEIAQYQEMYPWNYFNSDSNYTASQKSILLERKKQYSADNYYDLIINPSDPIEIRQSVFEAMDNLLSIKLRGWWDRNQIPTYSSVTQIDEPVPAPNYPATWPISYAPDSSLGKYGYDGLRRILANYQLRGEYRATWVKLLADVEFEMSSIQKVLDKIYKPWDSVVILRRLRELEHDLSLEQIIVDEITQVQGQSYQLSLTAEDLELLSEQKAYAVNRKATLETEYNWLKPRSFSPPGPIDESGAIFDAGQFIQPQIQQAHPEERIQILSRGPLSITITFPDQSPHLTSLGSITNVEAIVRTEPVFHIPFKREIDSSGAYSGDLNNNGFIDPQDGFEVDFRVTNGSLKNASSVQILDARIRIISGSATITDFGPNYGFLFNNSIDIGSVKSDTRVRSTYQQDLDISIPAVCVNGDSFAIQAVLDVDGVQQSIEFGPFVVGSLKNNDIFQGQVIATLPAISPVTQDDEEDVDNPTVYPTQDNLIQSAHLASYHLTKDGYNFWDQHRKVHTDVVLAEDLLMPTSDVPQKSLKLKWIGDGLPREDALHDPERPDVKYLDNVKTNNAVVAFSQTDGNAIIWPTIADQLVQISIDPQRGSDFLFRVDDKVVVYDFEDRNKMFVGIVTEVVIRDDSNNIEPSITLKLDKWIKPKKKNDTSNTITYVPAVRGTGTSNKILLENERMFKSPGVIWVGNERIVYWTRTLWSDDGYLILGSDDMPIQRGTMNTSSGHRYIRETVSYVSDGVTKTWQLPNINKWKNQLIGTIQSRLVVSQLKYGSPTDVDMNKRYAWIGSNVLRQGIDYTYTAPDPNDEFDFGSIALTKAIPVSQYKDDSGVITNAPTIVIDVEITKPVDALVPNSLATVTHTSTSDDPTQMFVYDGSLMHRVPNYGIADFRRAPWSTVYKSEKVVHVAVLEPTNIIVGDYWFDVLSRQLKTCIGVSPNVWEESFETIKDLKRFIVKSASAPAYVSGPQIGDLYLNETDDELYKYDGSAWVVQDKLKYRHYKYTPFLSDLVILSYHEKVEDFNTRENLWKQHIMSWT